MLKLDPARHAGRKSVRLEQRTTREAKSLIERAARLQGVNASEFMIAHATQAARETIARLETTRLNVVDRAAFMRAFAAEAPTPGLIGLLRVSRKAAARR